MEGTGPEENSLSDVTCVGWKQTIEALYLGCKNCNNDYTAAKC